jgi:hypothetical protein
MLCFLVPVMFEDGLEFRVLACMRALVVPVDGFQFLHQRHHGSMHIARFSGQFLSRLVIDN